MIIGPPMTSEEAEREFEEALLDYGRLSQSFQAHAASTAELMAALGEAIQAHRRAGQAARKALAEMWEKWGHVAGCSCNAQWQTWQDGKLISSSGHDPRCALGREAVSVGRTTHTHFGEPCHDEDSCSDTPPALGEADKIPSERAASRRPQRAATVRLGEIAEGKEAASGELQETGSQTRPGAPTTPYPGRHPSEPAPERDASSGASSAGERASAQASGGASSTTVASKEVMPVASGLNNSRPEVMASREEVMSKPISSEEAEIAFQEAVAELECCAIEEGHEDSEQGYTDLKRARADTHEAHRRAVDAARIQQMEVDQAYWREERDKAVQAARAETWREAAAIARAHDGTWLYRQGSSGVALAEAFERLAGK